MAGLYVLCGILAGFAAYRFGAARATMRRLNDTKRTMPGFRKTAWRHAGVAALLIGAAILLLYLAGHLSGK
jgi:hypothetical protein